jgi:O2-independent ubiquinone biosynthesis accessory factor UbiT
MVTECVYMFDIKRVNHKLVANIPPLVRHFNRYVPAFLQAKLISLALNQFFRSERLQGELAFLNGKTVILEVSDYQLRFAISLAGQELAVWIASKSEDLLISASSVDFLAMITNSIDPDTLFFRRRLLMLGDTELGLYCKNLLDSIGIERLPRPLPLCLHWLAQQQTESAAADHSL